MKLLFLINVTLFNFVVRAGDLSFCRHTVCHAARLRLNVCGQVATFWELFEARNRGFARRVDGPSLAWLGQSIVTALVVVGFRLCVLFGYQCCCYCCWSCCFTTSWRCAWAPRRDPLTIVEPPVTTAVVRGHCKAVVTKSSCEARTQHWMWPSLHALCGQVHGNGAGAWVRVCAVCASWRRDWLICMHCPGCFLLSEPWCLS